MDPATEWDGWILRRHDARPDGTTRSATLTGSGALDAVEGNVGTAIDAFWQADRPTGFLDQMRGLFGGGSITGNPWLAWWRCSARDLERAHGWWSQAVREAPCQVSKDGAMAVMQAGMLPSLRWGYQSRAPRAAMPPWMQESRAEFIEDANAGHQGRIDR